MIYECYTLLKKIEQRPVMWTGENTLKSIQTHASGYYCALVDYNIIQFKEEEFDEWIAQKLGYLESTAGWVHMILAYSIGHNPKQIQWEDFMNLSITDIQHENAIRLFYQLLEQYMYKE